MKLVTGEFLVNSSNLINLLGFFFREEERGFHRGR